MEEDIHIFRFFNKCIFEDRSNFVTDVNIFRRYIIDRFREVIPEEKLLVTLSLIDDII